MLCQIHSSEKQVNANKLATHTKCNRGANNYTQDQSPFPCENFTLDVTDLSPLKPKMCPCYQSIKLANWTPATKLDN